MRETTKNPLLVGAKQGAEKNTSLKKPYHTGIHAGRKRKFDRSLLPNPLSYYRSFFTELNSNYNNEWVSVRCCFHKDKNPSLRLNLQNGAFRCFGCGAHGGSVLAFHAQRNNLPFVVAVSYFGAWAYE